MHIKASSSGLLGFKNKAHEIERGKRYQIRGYCRTVIGVDLTETQLHACIKYSSLENNFKTKQPGERVALEIKSNKRR